MAETPYQAADLASILKTLSNFAPSPSSSILNAGTVVNPDSVGNLSHQASIRRERGAPNSSRPSTDKTTKDVDPRSIIEWSAGLRFITKKAADDQQLGYFIRKMIASQHTHEKQWWGGRQALIQKQQDRVEGRRLLDDVLRSVGGTVSSNEAAPDNAVELLSYDKKVYRAANDMQESMSSELKAIEVPFFCTDSSFIKPRSDGLQRHTSPDGPVGDGPSITAEELTKLQHRMLEFLEDMYKE